MLGDWHSEGNLRIWTDEDGERWLTNDYLCYGDYGGAGSVGAGNVRWLQEVYPDDVWVQHGHYSSVQAFLPDTAEYRELLAGLDDYPLFDDGSSSIVETEWESEAWTSWIRDDLWRAALKVNGLDKIEGDTLAEAHWTDALTEEQLWECYREAMESTNTYPETEYSGVYVDIGRIALAFARAVLARLDSF